MHDELNDCVMQAYEMKLELSILPIADPDSDWSERNQ